MIRLAPDQYLPWDTAAEKVSRELSGNWKRDPSLTYMLEHVSAEHAKVYLHRLRNEYFMTVDRITTACKDNDALGNAHVQTWLDGTVASPSSLRYLWQVMEIFAVLGEGANGATIVEVGGGYGGLALMMHKEADRRNVKFASYEIYDLPGAQALQSQYLQSAGISSVQFLDASSCGSDLDGTRTLLISNYAISEFDIKTSERYSKALMPKCTHGYLSWNTANVSSHVPKRSVIAPEIPQTGTYNVIIKW
jgi:putative sugar O-methyltransferase